MHVCVLVCVCVCVYDVFAGNPAERFGKVLESLGYAKHGQETMISGVTGKEMPCDIYIGLVYYQRLRHMVSDKFQVRARALCALHTACLEHVLSVAVALYTTAQQDPTAAHQVDM